MFARYAKSQGLIPVDVKSETYYFHNYLGARNTGKFDVPTGKVISAYTGPHDCLAIMSQHNSAWQLVSDTMILLDDIACESLYILKTRRSREFTGEEQAVILENDQRFNEIFLNLVMPEVHKFFTDPTLHQSSAGESPSCCRNVVLACFLEFFLQMLCVLLSDDLYEKVNNYKVVQKYNGEHRCNVTQASQILDKELTFLLAVLGDLPFQFIELQEVNTLLAEFEALAIEVGRWLYSYIYNDVMLTHSFFDGQVDAIQDKIVVLHNNIRKHCSKFSDLPRCASTPTANPIDAFFIVDSVLEDLDLITNDEVMNQIKTLQEELKYARSMVKDVTGPQVIAGIIELKECLKEIRDVAYEAEYLVISCTREIIHIWYFDFRVHSILPKILGANKMLEELHKICVDKKTKRAISREVSPKFEISPKADMDNVLVGFEDNKTNILGYLFNGSKPLQIISVTGMPGLGKTTIAKKLYDDALVRGHFDRRAWCVISQTYNRRRVLSEILMNISAIWNHDELSGKDEEILALEIHKNLKGSRYLIVLDDIWKSSTYDSLARYFPNDGNGSRIILTSRIKYAAPKNSVTYSPALLTESQCWELLEKRVFSENHCPSELLEIGKGLAESCKGLPLAVVVTAGILRNLEKEENAWRNVKEAFDANISNYTHGFSKILELSYEQLPDHLKLCFLYLAAFPEDTEIPIRKLIPMWISEGFIQKAKGKNQDVIAEGYVVDLIQRSLLLVARWRSDGGMKACGIHDLLRDMCVRKAQEENFMKSFVNDDVSIVKEHKRLFIDSTSTIWKNLGLHCRTMLGYFSEPPFRYGRLSLLRVMDQQQRDHQLLHAPMHLRYLGGSFMPDRHVAYDKMRDSSSFVNLKYLHLTGSIFSIPSFILKLINLRHLLVKYWGQYEEDCDYSQTNKLSYLSNVQIFNKKHEQILKCSPHLRRLKCSWNGEFPNLSSFLELESVTIEFEVRFKGEFTEGNFPSTIKKLHLSKIYLSCENMSILGSLPNLHVLKLDYVDFPENEWNTNEGEFLQLKFLKLQTTNLNQWNTDSEHFPELQHLVLEKCFELYEIVSELGDIPTLQTIEVRNCNEEIYESAALFEDEQCQNGNEELKVIISR